MKKHDTQEGTDTARPGTSLARSLKSIGWAFLGIRSSSTHQHETTRVSPLVLIAVAFVVVLLLVLGLMALVHWMAGGVGNPAN